MDQARQNSSSKKLCCSRILTSFIDFLLLWKAILANILSWIKFFGRTEREIQLECHLEIYPEFDRYLMWNWWFPAGFFSCKMSHLQANFCISEQRQLHSSKFSDIFKFDAISMRLIYYFDIWASFDLAILQYF